jgi:hypothetical protein
MGRGLRIKLLTLVSLLIMFSLEMVSELQRDGKGRNSRGRRGVGGCNNTSLSRSNFCLSLFLIV